MKSTGMVRAVDKMGRVVIPKEIRKQLGLWYSDVVWEDAFEFDMMYGEQVKKGDPIFPRLNIEKELEELAAARKVAELAKQVVQVAQKQIRLHKKMLKI